MWWFRRSTASADVTNQLMQPCPKLKDLLLGGVGVLGFEINVDLLADEERSRIRQIDEDLQNIDIAKLARIARIDPARRDDAGDGRYLAVKLAAAKRRGANQHTLPSPDSSKILLVHLGA